MKFPTFLLFWLTPATTVLSAALPRTPFPDGQVFPLPDGYPNPSPPDIEEIEKVSQTTFTRGLFLPPTISQTNRNHMLYLSFHEALSTALYSELLYNVTNRVEGFSVGGVSPSVKLQDLATFRAQEEMQSLTVNDIMLKFTNMTLRPCRFEFGVENLVEALELASLYVKIGAASVVESAIALAASGDAYFVGIITAVMAQEMTQVGYIQALLNKQPSNEAYIGPMNVTLAYSYFQRYVVPGSCPDASEVPFTVLPRLDVLNAPAAKDSNITVQFRFAANALSKPASALSLVFMNSWTNPVVQNTSVVYQDSDFVVVEAPYTFDNNFGLNYAVLSDSAGPFENNLVAADAAVVGPAVWQVDKIGE